VIEDLDGTAAEPSRRRHVAALSAAVAAISIALLLALIVPRSPEAAAPQAAVSPAPSPSLSSTLTMSSNPMRNVFVDLTRTSMCPDGMLLAPPYLLAFDDSSGGAFAVQSEPRTRSSARTSRAVPVTFVHDRQGRYIVTCVRSNILAPREGSIPD
jgi:hypothetical protein